MISSSIQITCLSIRITLKKCCASSKKAGLYVKTKKYEFHFNSIKYLEYILFSSRLSMSSDKIKTIQNCSEPRKIKDI